MNHEDITRLAGHMLTIGFEGLTLPADVRSFMQENAIANVILFQRNVSTAQQVQALTAEIQAVGRAAGLEQPVLISIDQENGTVGRLQRFAPGFMGAMAVGATQSSEVAYQLGRMTGQMLLSLGINANWAPVLDVNNNADNPVIGVRSYGDVASSVAQLGVATMRGLQDAGIMACGKHFPGHGDTDVDSHLGLPVIAHGRERLHAVELPPFEAAITASVDMIMTAHVVFEHLTENVSMPATLSPAVLTGLLRQELGFAGVIVTDCLEMDAIAEGVGIAEGAVQAIRAGADLVLVSHRLDRQQAALEAIVQAIEEGTISLLQVEESVRRIDQMKAQRTMASSPVPWSDALVHECRKLQEAVTAQGLTVLNWSSEFPLPPKSIRRIAVLRDTRTARWVASGDGDATPLVARVVQRFFPEATVDDIPVAEEIDDRALDFSAYDMVLAGVDGIRNVSYLHLLRSLGTLDIPYAVLLLRMPYDGILLQGVPTLLALYENTEWMVEAAIRALVGRGEALGRLPVHLSDQWPRGFSGYPNEKEGSIAPEGELT